MTDPDSNNPAIADVASLVGMRFGTRDLNFFPRLMARAALMGSHQSRSRGRGMDFEEVRQYQPGDDIRTIDWRVTARTLTPHTKLFREERERPVLIISDLRPGMFFGSRALKSVLACQVSAALGWAGLNANDRVGGLLVGAQELAEIRPKRSHHTVLQLIHKLRDFSELLLHGQSSRFSMADILKDCRRVALPGSTLFLVSDFQDLDRDCEQHLFELARHCDITLCHIYDPLEKSLPPPALYQVSDGEQRFVLNSRDGKLRQRFEQQFREHQGKLQRLANQLRMGLLTFNTAEPVLPVLQQAYSRKQKRHRR
ncbi:MAG: DUF58 domain-containing protein [Gammaproteobacteria bacterium]|nr:MAG: DUF58 domain-containing protein [Gammaproteobacteria bacterium]